MKEPQGAARLMGADEERRVVGHVCYGSNVVTQCPLNKCFATIAIIELNQIIYLNLSQNHYT